MTRAIFDGLVIAESDDVRVLEGMTYFPIDSIETDRLVVSPTTTRCVWKGKASYFHVWGHEGMAMDAAFAYQRPWPLARRLVANRIAFWRNVDVVDE